MITIVDYGVGNIRAFLNTFKRLGVEATTATTPEAIAPATKLILPGVGDFDQAMARLDASGMRPALDEAVTVRKVPVLGVCVGMQMLGRSSEEGSRAGLGWIDGEVIAFTSTAETSRMPVPHMGWNEVRPQTDQGLFRGLDASSRFYFLHSYYFRCNSSAHVAASSTYGFDFCSAVSAGHVAGVQFHPEKSHASGLTLLRNFATS